MAPLDTFMSLHTTNDALVLLEYAFALCQPGAWPFLSTMDINILPEACLAYDADSKNPLEDPANTNPDTNARTGKRHHRHKGKSKNQSKSAGATSSASEMSPGRKTQTSCINAALAKQVAQDLHLSSDGSDSKNPEETNKDSPSVRDSQLFAGTTRPESEANLPGTPAPKLATPAVPPEKDADTEETLDPPQPGVPVPKPITPDST